jgi:hypothetical protein
LGLLGACSFGRFVSIAVELLLAVRTRERLGQALSSAQHAEGHLQLVGVGEWSPTSTRPSWDTDPRLGDEEEEQSS